MNLSTNPTKAKKILNDFLEEFDNLSKQKYSDGYEILDDLDKRICMVIESIFPNDKNKIDSYKYIGSPFYFLEKMVARGLKPSLNIEQDRYLTSLKAKKSYIYGLITQIELIPNNEKDVPVTMYIAIGLFLFGILLLFGFNEYYFGGFLSLLSIIVAIITNWAGLGNFFKFPITLNGTKITNQIIVGNNNTAALNYRGNMINETLFEEKKELINKINEELKSEKISNVLIKCIRLAKIIDSKKDIAWLETEAYGYPNDEKIKSFLPDYRKINGKIEIMLNNRIEKIEQPLGITHPIFTIENWVESYEKSSQNEILFRGSLSDQLKELFQKYKILFSDSLEEDVPYAVSLIDMKQILYRLKIRISEFVNSLK